VRNSGARAVVEGIGDHGCEYMTGGVAVILGPTGRNFAAGMSGGLAYVYDPNKNFEANCNKGLVDLFPVEEDEDIVQLKTLLKEHLQATLSTVAHNILDNWNEALPQFTKVYPRDYRRVIEERKRNLVQSMLDDVA
jgi:glutamate synthase (NADPH) large chain